MIRINLGTKLPIKSFEAQNVTLEMVFEKLVEMLKYPFQREVWPLLAIFPGVFLFLGSQPLFWLALEKYPDGWHWEVVSSFFLTFSFGMYVVIGHDLSTKSRSEG